LGPVHCARFTSKRIALFFASDGCVYRILVDPSSGGPPRLGRISECRPIWILATVSVHRGGVASFPVKLGTLRKPPDSSSVCVCSATNLLLWKYPYHSRLHQQLARVQK